MKLFPSPRNLGFVTFRPRALCVTRVRVALQSSIAAAMLLCLGSHVQAGSFQAAASLNSARQGHTATLLQNGKVLVAGGLQTHQAQFQALATVELYDPAT